MKLRSVAVLGGGPGGLYAARLMKLQYPESEVVVHEQTAPQETFGFGVGLAGRTQRNLRAADPLSLESIVEAAWPHDSGMAVGERRVVLPGDNLIAISRAVLLEVLRRHAEDIGVIVRSGERVSVEDLEADLVIAADGVSSATRELWAADFGVDVQTHDSLYLWCGTDFSLPSAVFRPVDTEYGTFVAHAYPYQDGRSTFLIETDRETWLRAGFDRSTDETPWDESDQHSLAYLAKAFDEELHGHPLIGNRTRWSRFRTISCARWHRGNVVLLGDAVHTAHYSIGSGTKLAMEDAIALVRELGRHDDLESALIAYEYARRPAVEHLQDTARRSMLWWDSFPWRLDLSVEQLLMSYMTRAGKVSIERFSSMAPEVVGQALADYAGIDRMDVPADGLDDWVLSRPLVRDGTTWTQRRVDPDELPAPTRVDVADAWSPDADRLVATLAAAPRPDGDPIVLGCARDGGAALTMFDVAERLRRDHEAVVAAVLPEEFKSVAVAALASERADLVAWRG
jgi:anthraniloyl-CoA monooxygenase